MLRRLYRWAVRFDPSAFRRRFGNGVLGIFDPQRGALAAVGVMLNRVFSLFRQWTLPPHVRIDLPAAPLRSPTSDHIPSFETLESFQPRASALIHGTLLSVILFLMSVFAIRYSWMHVSNLHFPEIAAGGSPQPVDVIRAGNHQTRTIPTRWTSPLSRDSEKSSEDVHADVISTEAADAQSKAIASTTPPVPAATVPPRGAMILLDRYVGKYISKYPPAKISIQIERDPLSGDHLSLSLAAGGQPSLALSPTSPAKFVILGAEKSYVDFSVDAQGRVCCLSLVVNRKVITAQRQ